MIVDLPTPVTNNAVASRRGGSESCVYSLLGLGASKRFDGLTNACFVFSTKQQGWVALPQLDDSGRIAATSQCVGDKVYLFGGYSVAADGSEHTSPSVNIYDACATTWSHGTEIPVPVDDCVSVVYLDRYVYLISGWSETKNVNNVQLYDTQTDRWAQATAIHGTPLFGHCGSIVGRNLYYFDGVSDTGGQFTMSSGCWLGEIDPASPSTYNWWMDEMRMVSSRVIELPTIAHCAVRSETYAVFHPEPGLTACNGALTRTRRSPGKSWMLPVDRT